MVTAMAGIAERGTVRNDCLIDDVTVGAYALAVCQ